MATPPVDRICHCRICVPEGTDPASLDDHDRKLLTDVARRGWHLVQIPDDEIARGWVFSVGMWHTLGSPELIVLGLEVANAARLLNQLGDRVGAGLVLGPNAVERDLFEGDEIVTFEPVHHSWYVPLLGYAMWFAQEAPLPVVQVIWSDRLGRWPWSADADVAHRHGQPRLSIPAREHRQGAWSAVLAPDPWPFADAPETLVFTTGRIALDGAAVTGVAHDVDGSWQFLDGGSVTRADIELVHLAHVIGAHPGLAEVMDLAPGQEAWLTDGHWVRRAIAGDTT